MPSHPADSRFAAPLLLSAVVSGACAQAEPPTLADRLSTMDAQLQLLRKQFELDQALSISAVATVGALPRVVAVYGFEPKLQARLLLAGGMVGTFSEGDTIRGAMKVVAISPRAVVVSVMNGGKTRSVPLEFVAAQTAPAGMPLPPGFPGAVAPPGPQPGPLPPELLPLPPALGVPLPATNRQQRAGLQAPPAGGGGAAASARQRPPERQP